MEMIRKNDVGAVVEDVQGRLVTLGLLSEEQRTGVADDATIAALESFDHLLALAHGGAAV